MFFLMLSEVWHKIFYVEYCSFCSILMLHKKFDYGVTAKYCHDNIL